MPDHDPARDSDPAPSPWQRLLLRTIGLLVPDRIRERWRREWLAEVAYRRRRARPAPVGGALVDAVHLRREAWNADSLRQDLRQAGRALTSRPGFSAVVVTTLALGIAANSVIFSVVDAVLLAPQPYPDSGRLTMLYTDNRIQGWPRDVSSYPNFRDWRERSRSFASMAAYSYTSLNLTGDGDPLRIRAAAVTPSLFEVLEVPATLGRTLVRADQDEGRNVVVLSHAFWRQRFGADPSAMGRQLQLDGVARRVVGVMPARFRFPSETVDMWVPFRSGVADSSRANLWLRVIGRLRSGVELEAAREEMAAVAAALEQEHPGINEGLGVNLVALHEDRVGDVRPALLVLLGAVGLVLLVACANVGHLLLARAADRRREIAVRAALGASRGRIVRQLLCESTLLAVLAGAVGLGLGVVALAVLAGVVPADIPRLEKASLDISVTTFVVVLSVATGLGFGLLPALHASGGDLQSRLRDGARGGTDRRGSRARQVLVVAEVALAVVLLTGAGLLVRSIHALQQVDPGLRTEDVLAVRLALPESRYGAPREGRALFLQLVERLEALPEVESAAAVQVLPLTTSAASADISIEGRPPLTGAQRREVRSNVVTPGYFHTVGIPLLRGETPWGRDDAGRPVVAAVNEAFAGLFFPGEDPVGERFTWGEPEPDEEVAWVEITGVVGDVHQTGPEETVAPEAYLSIEQVPRSAMNVLVRTDGDPLARIGAVREQVWSLDRDLPVDGVVTLGELLDRTYSRRRFTSRLLALFAASAALLASLGLYGLMAHSVAGRRREIGVRMALGARRSDVTGLVLREALTLTGLGLILGMAAATLLTRLLASLLYGVGSRDPATFGAVALLLTVVAALASWLPARRAATTEPVTALGQE